MIRAFLVMLTVRLVIRSMIQCILFNNILTPLLSDISDSWLLTVFDKDQVDVTTPQHLSL